MQVVLSMGAPDNRQMLSIIAGKKLLYLSGLTLSNLLFLYYNYKLIEVGTIGNSWGFAGPTFDHGTTAT